MLCKRWLQQLHRRCLFSSSHGSCRSLTLRHADVRWTAQAEDSSHQFRCGDLRHTQHQPPRRSAYKYAAKMTAATDPAAVTADTEQVASTPIQALQFPPADTSQWPACTHPRNPPRTQQDYDPAGLDVDGFPYTPLPQPPPSTATQPFKTLKFTVNAEIADHRARAATMVLPHGTVHTPVFMPVGTQGTIKGLTSDDMHDLDYKLILGNTYHLSLRPGAEKIDILGGLHDFMHWKHNLLTDSGGFQMVSLIDLAEITERGVHFQSPVDGKSTMLTPEESVRLQNLIGADILMMLDDVCSSLTPEYSRFVEASARTIRWLDRCISAHSRPAEQSLFGIVQGGLDVRNGGLRAQNLADMIARDPWLPGYAIGGLAGGEDKHHFWRVVAQCCRALPKNKPRYLMGVGYPVDLVVCTALGVDMFDCVWPCRTARFGTAIVPTGLLQLGKQQFRNAVDEVIDSKCGCSTCKHGQGYSRSYLSALVGRDSNVCTLITIHNLYAIKQLMNGIRQSIVDGRHTEFVQQFMIQQFPSRQYPVWVIEALQDVGIELLASEG